NVSVIASSIRRKIFAVSSWVRSPGLVLIASPILRTSCRRRSSDRPSTSGGVGRGAGTRSGTWVRRSTRCDSRGSGASCRGSTSSCGHHGEHPGVLREDDLGAGGLVVEALVEAHQRER